MSTLKFNFWIMFMALSIFSLGQSNWQINENYSIHFKGSGAEGNFYGLDGNITFNTNDLKNSSFDVFIDPSTISTGNKTKDKHARDEPWFDVDKFTKIQFKSNEIEKITDGYLTIGELTMLGVTKTCEIKFDFKLENQRIAKFVGHFTVNRRDFGIDGPFMAFMVGDEFDIEIEVETSR